MAIGDDNLARDKHRDVGKMSDDRLTMLTERIRQGVAQSASVEGRLKYDFSDDGAILIDGSQSPAKVDNSEGPSDCTVEMALGTLEKILNGALTPNTAFQQGKICLKGDMGIAMKTTAILQKVRV